METIALHNILGHPHILEFLGNTLQVGPVGHAYLFYGPDGIGKEIAAKRFSQALLCPNSKDSGDACDACDSCRRFLNNAHPNFLLMEPEGKFNYKVDQLRDLRKNVSFTAYQGDRRVFLIPEADKMQPEGANAILKTLEEPGSGVILILISSNLLRILPTILSRCQQVRFGRLSSDVIEKILSNHESIDPMLTKLTTLLSEGSPGKAIAYQSPAFSALRNGIYSSLSKHSPGDLYNALEIPRKIIDTRKKVESDNDIKIDINLIYDLLIYWFRDIFVYRATRDESKILNIDFQKEIIDISGKWSWITLRAALQQLEYLKYISLKNIGAQFSCETVLLRAAQVVS